MSLTKTVTGKIPAEHIQKLQEHGVNISELIWKAVEMEVRRIEEERREALNEASQLLQRIPDKEILDSIIESRDRVSHWSSRGRGKYRRNQLVLYRLMRIYSHNNNSMEVSYGDY